MVLQEELGKTKEIGYSIPHTGYMKLLDRIESLDLVEGQGCFSVTLAEGKPYFNRAGEFIDCWLVELMAQGVASLYFHQANQAVGVARPGFLIAIDKCTFSLTHDPQPGSNLLINVELETVLHLFGIFETSAWQNGLKIAAARMKFLDRQ